MCRTGNIIIQARKITGEDEAFQVQAMLPLLKWIRLDYYIQDSEVKRQRMTGGGMRNKNQNNALGNIL